MSKKCVIIGGGIIGLSCAYYLQKTGHEVTVIDQSDMNSGASYVNAGYLTPSHIMPLAAPGVMKQGLKWMLSSKSPLYIKPRLNAEFLKWTMAFNNSCSSENVAKAIPAIRDINLFSRDLYSDIKESENFNFQLEKNGLLMLCQSEKMLEEEGHVLAVAHREGLPAKMLSAEEVQQKMPDAKLNIKGAAYYECDWHTTPGEFMQEFKMFLEQNGVQFLKNEQVTDFEKQGEKITKVQTQSGKAIEADEVILATGAWAGTLNKKLNLNILMQAGKGYRINSNTETGITLPSILCEAKVAITPMNGFTRYAGTMEIAGINHDINKARVDAIAEAVPKYFPEVSISEQEKADAQCGLRPVTPDGLPYIGRTSKWKNLTIAAGHAMMGWSLGPATGLLVSEVINGKKPSLDLGVYNPDRKF
ncbi:MULTISPECIES: FAD-binding oxidoreductase [unclassified Leeuwenhoekiella]|uniref:NAD(P)/FAD-dependent oxidoreductase n=1 Tax=unclassified Leeuwenhoekiella TaxID=2615029 RepID=UPI000C4F2A95|nr:MULTISPECIES: FAD-dependent oxidoreductase [unclassified Leeuwenhoekiella]MBA82483.1 amino acid dehydrogenase [Leeuwenhoekiella sp.]|tara:strand:- start:11253 stop:12503 length:1251 start_codon:yes stop_codon:yes gene_type:complete